MAISNEGIDDSKYVLLKALIYATTIITIAITESISNKLLAFCAEERQLHLNHVITGN